MLYYAGVGSRETPEEVLLLMEVLATNLEQLGFVLRSGGAEGADSAFEKGVHNNYRKEIFLPWKGYCDSTSPLFSQPSKEVLDLTEKYHPYFHRLKRGAVLLQARNCKQVLREDLQTPSSFVVCWTKGGKAGGGTGQAIRIARAYSIPVFDLFHHTGADVLNFAKGLLNHD